MIEDILFQIVLFLSNMMQTITGFAGTMLAMPFSIKLVGVEEAKAVLNIFTMLACAVIAVQNRKNIQVKILGKMILGMVLGMVVGIWLFELLPLEILLTGYGILVICVALKKMLVKKEVKLPEWMMLFVLLAAGIIHGMFLSGGALLVVYAVSVLKDKDQFRATVAPVWVILNAMLIGSHYSSGYYNRECLMAIGISIVPLVLSILAGNYLYKRIKQEHFMNLTYVLLIISGVSLLV